MVLVVAACLIDHPVAIFLPRLELTLKPPMYLHRLLLICSLTWMASVAMQPLSTSVAESAVNFTDVIQPIFAQKCVTCHGPGQQEGGLRLDVRIRAIGELASGQIAIVPGAAAASELIGRVTSDDEELRMPPVASGEALSNTEIEALRSWIDAGAEWQVHWAYRPLGRPAPPPTESTSWSRNAIDHFVLAQLEELGISPSSRADRYTLIKRLYFDLLGLPAAPEGVDKFLADEADDAYERVVDRLLDSPQFGELWARHWLDKARYADSDGYEKDRPRPDAWRYRDWVIDSINQDLPYDQFSTKQLAGDLVGNATSLDRLATAFHRQTLTNTEGGVDQEEFRVKAIIDRVNTTGTVWLGLTVGCAQCHSHKYDQITQQEYYRLFAFYNNGDEADTKVPVAQFASDEKARALQVELESLEQKLAERRAELARDPAPWEQRLIERIAAGNNVVFQPLDIHKIESAYPVDFRQLDDGSTLVEGPNPSENMYSVYGSTRLTDITGVRIEVLADPSLGGGGPGRTPHGNFALSEVRVYAGKQEPMGIENRVTLAMAEADYSQANYDISAAIDGDLSTGWGVSSEYNQNHHADITLATLVHTEPDGDRPHYVQVVLDQRYGKQHTIGRFRIQLRQGNMLKIPNAIEALLAKDIAQWSQPEQDQLFDYWMLTDRIVQELQTQIDKIRQKTEMMVRVIARREDLRKTHVLHRGDFLQPGEEEIVPATLDVLPGMRPRKDTGMADRLDLAHWLFDEANPLVPRVAVNHVWSQLFGHGIVRTMDDFGVRGEAPTHSALLDWLAVEYRRLGWSRKALIKTILMSATYQQASRFRPNLLPIDPENRQLYRQNRLRAEAEIIRDMYLAAGGLLSSKIGGPSVFPPLPAGVAKLSYASNFSWNTSEGQDRYRRGMYTFFKRTAPHPNLTIFDCPDANTTVVQRTTSNTPLGALATLNNEVFVEAAQGLARRVLATIDGSDTARMMYAMRVCVARPATGEELQLLLGLLEESRTWYVDHPNEAKAMIGNYQPDGIPATETAAWVVAARTILNQDEFITRE
jgi:hypothetical protein